jgi:hypothetical protein
LAQRIEFIDFYTQATPIQRESGKANHTTTYSPLAKNIAQRCAEPPFGLRFFGLTYQLVK